MTLWSWKLHNGHRLFLKRADVFFNDLALGCLQRGEFKFY